MKRKEYGGCLYFELGLSSSKDYYANYTERRIEVDCGRSAIQYLIEKNQYRRIWLPVYNCPLVYERIKDTCNIEIQFYNIRNDFLPNIKLSELKDGDALLWVNYFGVMQDEIIDRVARIGEEKNIDIIIDNIPAFFSKPRMNAYNIYSCRKFVGVPDGGYIIGDKIIPEELPTYDTSENYNYLCKALGEGSNSVYSEYQKRELKINQSIIAYGMPVMTKHLLRYVDYDVIKRKRRENFGYLHELLGNSNRFSINHISGVPLIYPYLSSDEGLHDKLISKKVFVSRFWKHILMNEKSNIFEKDLAKYLIPLPIDQRYSKEDMEAIASIVMRETTIWR